MKDINRSLIRVNSVDIEIMTFPGGERHLTLPPHTLVAGSPGEVVEAILYTADGIMDLLLVADAIERAGSYIDFLTVPYMPYARQDRVANQGEPLSIAVMARLINDIGAHTVRVFDPHSPVTEALIRNIDVTEQADVLLSDTGMRVMGDYLNPGHDLVIIAPDAGAEKKALKVAQAFKAPMETARKVRNTQTGEISRTLFSTETVLAGKNLLIVDDICDGGRTFVELAKVLIPHNPAKIGLFVTHGLFTKGMGPFEDLIDDIYCVDYVASTIQFEVRKMK